MAALLVPLAAGNILLVDDMLISGSCVVMHGSRPVSSEAAGCTNTCPARAVRLVPFGVDIHGYTREALGS